MTITPEHQELVAKVCNDYRLGLPVLLHDAGSTVMTVAIETCPESRMRKFLGHESSYIILTRRRAETLRARCYDGDIARVVAPSGIDPAWVYSLANPATDLAHPMKGPLASIRTGSAKLPRVAIRLARRARLLPAIMARELEVDDETLAERNLTLASAGIVGNCLDSELDVERVVSATIPLEVDESARITVFRSLQYGDEHCMIEIGNPRRDTPALVRLHSACFTGDVLGSLKCDCGKQLDHAMRLIAGHGSGVIMYMNQEGRGIGLSNKIRAYAMQDQGYDTVEANHRLGFEDDERDFRIAATMLKDAGFDSIDLITNNPAKVVAMEAHGMPVENRIPIVVGITCHNREYILTKARKSGHLL